MQELICPFLYSSLSLIFFFFFFFFLSFIFATLFFFLTLIFLYYVFSLSSSLLSPLFYNLCLFATSLNNLLELTLASRVKAYFNDNFLNHFELKTEMMKKSSFLILTTRFDETIDLMMLFFNILKIYV